jgi:hypothetical protein
MELSTDFAHHGLKDLTLIEPHVNWPELLHLPTSRQLFAQLTHLRTTRCSDVNFDIDFCFTSLTHLSFKRHDLNLDPMSASLSDVTRFPVLQRIVPSFPYMQWRLLQPMTLRVKGRALDKRMNIIACPKKWKELGVWEEGGPEERDLWDRAMTTEFLQRSRAFSQGADDSNDDDSEDSEDHDHDDIHGYVAESEM